MTADICLGKPISCDTKDRLNDTVTFPLTLPLTGN